jgi:AcrR family transcriptional regulator
MARPRKSEIHSDNRREALVIAAARLFREKGFNGTSMRDIAAAAHMQSGSPFYHFASKQDLLFAGVERGLRACLQVLEAIDARSMAPAAYFRALAREHLGHLLEDRIGVAPLVVDEWRHLEGANRAAILDLRRRYEQLWTGALQGLHAAGLGGRAEKMECYFFLGALHSVYSWYRPEGPLSPVDMADRLVDWVLGP